MQHHPSNTGHQATLVEEKADELHTDADES